MSAPEVIVKFEPDPVSCRFLGGGMKHAVKHIDFAGIGLDGGVAPSSLNAAMPRPQGTQESQP
jgi:hypothetical protein